MLLLLVTIHIVIVQVLVITITITGDKRLADARAGRRQEGRHHDRLQELEGDSYNSDIYIILTIVRIMNIYVSILPVLLRTQS